MHATAFPTNRKQESEATERAERMECASGHILPCNGDVAIPLCARLRSVALFRLPLVGIRCSNSLIPGICLRRCPFHLGRL
jgi:hypothetical protein